jgi:hypothetical protein
VASSVFCVGLECCFEMNVWEPRRGGLCLGGLSERADPRGVNLKGPHRVGRSEGAAPRVAHQGGFSEGAYPRGPRRGGLSEGCFRGVGQSEGGHSEEASEEGPCVGTFPSRWGFSFGVRAEQFVGAFWRESRVGLRSGPKRWVPICGGRSVVAEAVGADSRRADPWWPRRWGQTRGGPIRGGRGGGGRLEQGRSLETNRLMPGNRKNSSGMASDNRSSD